MKIINNISTTTHFCYKTISENNDINEQEIEWQVSLSSIEQKTAFLKLAEEAYQQLTGFPNTIRLEKRDPVFDVWITCDTSKPNHYSAMLSFLKQIQVDILQNLKE